MHNITSWIFRRKVESEPISDEQWDALFSATPPAMIDPKWAGQNRRRESRQRCEHIARLYVDLSGAGQRRFLIRTRDLSEMGVGFVHAQRIEPGTKCTIVFMTRDHLLLQRQAVVASCRRYDRVFIVGMRFHKPVDPHQVIGAESEAA